MKKLTGYGHTRYSYYRGCLGENIYLDFSDFVSFRFEIQNIGIVISICVLVFGVSNNGLAFMCFLVLSTNGVGFILIFWLCGWKPGFGICLQYHCFMIDNNGFGLPVQGFGVVNNSVHFYWFALVCIWESFFQIALLRGSQELFVFGVVKNS